MVGGGIIGAACAEELTRRGASVTLLERDELASGASGRNQGLWVPPEDPTLHAIASRSLARYLEIADEAPLPIGIDARPIGTVFVAVDEEALGAAKDILAGISAGGFAVSELDDAALVEAEPELARDLVAAWFIDAGHRLDPAEPARGNFLFADVGGGRELFERLLREGVIVRPLEGFGAPEAIRVTVGAPEENEAFAVALGHVLSGVS